MEKKPKIYPAAIDLLARVFNSHKKGLPEWMKNAREAYLRKDMAKEDRFIILNYRQGKTSTSSYLECIDFVGISGDEIESRYLEWANPEAAAKGLKPGDVEGGQGNGGKAYLRQMFEKGFFVSVSEGKLSVVSFTDQKKYVLDFVPDEKLGKDIDGDSPVLPGIRKYLSDWLKVHKLPPGHNITMVRGVAPTKPIDPDRLLEEIQQFPQARESIGACHVHFYVNSSFRRALGVVEPDLHPAYPNPIKIPIPLKLQLGSSKVITARPPDFPIGELELRISAKPLQGQSLASWNRIDFYGIGLSVIGWKKSEELPLKFPQYSRYVFGRCTVPLLVDTKDNYELQGRVHLNEGPLASALYSFIGEEADRLLAQIAKQEASSVATKKRKNLEKLNLCLAKWIESKLPFLRGLSETGTETGGGTKDRKKREKKEHQPPITLAIHRETVQICQGVSYQFRAVAYDAGKLPVPPGKVVWKSQNPSVVSVHPENGTIEAKSEGLAVVTVANEAGLTSTPVLIQVHEAVELSIKGKSPAKVSSNRRLQLVTEIRTRLGKTLKDVIVSWRSSDERVVTVGQDGWLVGGEVGEAEVIAHVGPLESDTLVNDHLKFPPGRSREIPPSWL